MQSIYSSLFLSRKAQFLFASLMWTIVGFGLIMRGMVFLVSESRYTLLVVAVLLGIAKYFLVFRNTARKNRLRMEQEERSVVIWSVFPLRTWILIAAMIILGILIRLSPLPREIYSLVISGVGLGLFMASAVFWKAWRNEADGAHD